MHYSFNGKNESMTVICYIEVPIKTGLNVDRNKAYLNYLQFYYYYTRYKT